MKKKWRLVIQWMNDDNSTSVFEHEHEDGEIAYAMCITQAWNQEWCKTDSSSMFQVYSTSKRKWLIV